MPNHVRNILTITGEGAEEVYEKIAHPYEYSEERDKGQHPYIDFNNIIPMPRELDVVSGSPSLKAKEILRDMEKTGNLKEAVLERINDIPDNLRTYLENYFKYGYMTWYEWCCDKWGTKWNAYSQKKDGTVIQFETAWTTPVPVIEKLSQQFPEVDIHVDYADESYGENCGSYTYRGGERIEEWYPVEDATQWSCEVWGDNYEEWLAEYGEE